MRSAAWPIVSPVEGSAMAGGTGIRSRGRTRPNARSRAPRLRARDALHQSAGEPVRDQDRNSRQGLGTARHHQVGAATLDQVRGVGDGSVGGRARQRHRDRRNRGGQRRQSDLPGHVGRPGVVNDCAEHQMVHVLPAARWPGPASPARRDVPGQSPTALRSRCRPWRRAYGNRPRRRPAFCPSAPPCFPLSWSFVPVVSRHCNAPRSRHFSAWSRRSHARPVGPLVVPWGPRSLHILPDRSRRPSHGHGGASS